jgi:hypothetical protein
MASTTVSAAIDEAAISQRLTTAREEDQAFVFTALLNAAFRAEELGVAPETFLEICRAAAAPHQDLVKSQVVTIKPSSRLRELGLTPERFLEMSELIVSVMRQLLMENLG